MARIPLDDDNFDELAVDRLQGAGEIAAFWFGADTPTYRKRVFYLVERGLIPAGKIGGHIIASRRRLREAYEQLTNPTAAAE